MVTRKVKFSMSIKEIHVDFEGSQELGQQIQQGVQQALGSLVNTQSRLLAATPEPKQVIDALVQDVQPAQGNGHGSQPWIDANGDKAKRPRQRRTKGGPSIANLLLSLKQERYFSQARTGADVLVHLKDNKGHNSRENSVRTELQRMVQRGDLFRMTNGENVYVYKDTPFDESPRSPSSAEQPAQ